MPSVACQATREKGDRCEPVKGLRGKTALVTGAAGGMGLEASRRLCAEEARVYGVDKRPPNPGEAPSGAVFEVGDAGDEGLMSALAAQAVEETGRLDYLVNAAGVLWFDRDTLADRDSTPGYGTRCCASTSPRR